MSDTPIKDARIALEEFGKLGKYYDIEVPNAKYATFKYMNGSTIVVERSKSDISVSLWNRYNELLKEIEL